MGWIQKLLVPVAVTLIGAFLLFIAGSAAKRFKLRRALVRLRVRVPGDEDIRLVLRHVRDGKDVITGPREPLNRDRVFRYRSGRGEWCARTWYARHLGFQFKCYVDFPGMNKNEVYCWLADSGFEGIREDETLTSTRLWFLLPTIPKCDTVDGYTNNFFQAGLREIACAAEPVLPADSRAR